ncbi:amino acid adenylation domain-containing protein [Streptomyces sp. P9(2023)]|uniref:non-ribosomal peptide synthetase n=1 Tax=Streptomyces sp. P9(2023) TaxID=3064394 RepID=UPI0028F4069B|nr:amino acid adenylation domain-containing protein [Streptomyces sp. P9(2023)]MDT9687534.1 amino acid adenylation domain-containing protein [Streptomyces sp. P9(2023)]
MSIHTAESRIQLSFGQEQLWFLDQMSPGETTYNVPMAYRLRGALDTAALEGALNLLVRRHEQLRVTFHAADGVPYQVVSPAEDRPLPVRDLSGLSPEEAEETLRQELQAEADTPFDLAAGPISRFQLFRLAADHHVLGLSFHHIVTDGWSGGVVSREIAQAYADLSAGREPSLPELSIGYGDHIQRQRKQRADGVWEEELKFWEERLAGLEALELPADRIRPAEPTQNGETFVVEFPSELLAKARTLAHEQGASLYMVVAAAMNVVLSRYSGQDDIALGVPMLGRTDPELEDVVGLFINMTVLRCDLSGEVTFTELLERIADANLDMYDNQDVPFDHVVDRVQTTRDAGRNPLFQIACQLLGETSTGDSLQLTGLTSESITVATSRSRFDLSFSFIEGPERLRLIVEFATDLYDRWRVEAMMKHFSTVLGAAADAPETPVSELPLLSEEERRELLDVGRGADFEYTTEPVHATIARIAEENPELVAAVCRGVEMTYGELMRRAGKLARYIRSRGVRQEEVVAIAMDRDLDALVAILGVMVSGAAYTIIDPSHPNARLDHMLRDTKSPLVITRAASVGDLPDSCGWESVRIDADWAEIEAQPDGEPLEEWAEPTSLVYVLYTSGSTGRPKGVMIEQRGLRMFIEAYRRTFGEWTTEDRLLQLPALTFDMSQGEIFAGLISGSAMILVAPEDASSPESLGGLIRDQRVTYAGLSPAILSVVEAGPYPDLKYIMGGAEALPAELVNKWNLPGRKFVNLYGPTEASVATTEYLCEHKEWQSSPPIGRPEFSRLHYVVDKEFNLVPVGVPGELLIGGDEGLARGYLNLPEMTDEKFVPDPFLGEGRVYRTGDLVRWTRDLQIDFIGRLDNQVKLRGLRIELGEIESGLLTHPKVRMALVLLREDYGEKQLVAYYTVLGDTPPTVAELREHLGRTMPEYMVPTGWVELTEFPLTPARKIDRAKLPAPASGSGDATASFVAPVTATEEKVAEVFGTVLSMPQVSADGNFFELGGNSLQAMRVVSRLNKHFGVKVNVRMLYGGASVATVAAAIDSLVESKAGSRG